MTKLHPTSVVEDGAKLGQDVEIGPYCIVGSQVILGNIGQRTTIREGATLNPGTQGGGMQTIIGDGDYCLIMTGAHVGNHSIIVTLAGHGMGMAFL